MQTAMTNWQVAVTAIAEKTAKEVPVG